MDSIKCTHNVTEIFFKSVDYRNLLIGILVCSKRHSYILFIVILGYPGGDSARCIIDVASGITPGYPRMIYFTSA